MAAASSSLGIFSVRLKRGPMPAEERKRLGCHCCKQARGYGRNGIMPVCWSSSYFCANLEGMRSRFKVKLGRNLAPVRVKVAALTHDASQEYPLIFSELDGLTRLSACTSCMVPSSKLLFFPF